MDAVDGKNGQEDEVVIEESEIDFFMELMNNDKKARRSTKNDDEDDDNPKKRSSRKRKRNEMTREKAYEILRERKLAQMNMNKKETTKMTNKKQETIEIVPIEDRIQSLIPTDDNDDIALVTIENLMPELGSKLRVLKDLENLIEESAKHQRESSALLRKAEQTEEELIAQHVAASQIVEDENSPIASMKAFGSTFSPSTQSTANFDESDEPIEEGEKIEINVRCGPNETLKFNLKGDDTFDRLINSICKKKELQKEKVKLIFDGQAIKPQQKPQDLDMEDGDLVELKV